MGRRRAGRRRAGRVGGYGLRGRHIRQAGYLRVSLPLTVGEPSIPEDRLVLQVLRRRPLVDLDAAQVAAEAGLPPSLTVQALQRLVRVGLVEDVVVDGRLRFGLL